jgi:hypothetical protein
VKCKWILIFSLGMAYLSGDFLPIFKTAKTRMPTIKMLCTIRMNMENRPPIPAEIKRAVRQRCGFGCVVCGFPLYEYEHMLEWAVVKRHKENEITLLCRKHHGMKTGGLLPIVDVKEANDRPYNMQTGLSKNVTMSYSGKDISFFLGNTCFKYQNLAHGSFVAPIVIDGLVMVGFRAENNKLLLSFSAFDEVNKPILIIEDNELVYDTTQWDIEWIAQTLTIRERKGKIILQLRFEPPGVVRFLKGRFLRNGVEILVGKNYFFNTNKKTFISGLTMMDLPVGLSIGSPKPNCLVGMELIDVNRYQNDRIEARRFLKKSLNHKRLKSHNT